MNREREKKLVALFRTYNRNKREYNNGYSEVLPRGVAYDKIKVKGDISKNSQEEMLVAYSAKREELAKKIYIVEEVLNWFKLEGHGRDRFIKLFMIDGCSWTKAEMDCHISNQTVLRWRREVLDKAEMVAGWLNYL